MGICNSRNIFTEQELSDYKNLTYLTEKEIYRCHEDYGKLAGLTDKNDIEKIKQVKIDFKTFKNKSNKFSGNPFAERIFRVFSKDDRMSFEDYLNLMSVFSEGAPTIIKCLYAYDIYNFENRDYLRKNDIRKLIQILTGHKISSHDLNSIVDKVFAEADFYDNEKITLDEFEHIVSNSTEFARNFCVRVF